ncbi:glycosyltransferase [Flavobacterium sp.]|jgi:glycosyltransferase involved in cell wall biosynthesis|uniref:glycosyltransferase n=1 Tax=Flavobacterium sp. TaxID=239 RepID=UPI0037C19A4B
MRILLIGEYSRLHNSLKEGLIHLGHEVTLVGDGDDFKNYPVDYSIDAKISKSKPILYLRRFVFKISKFDFAKIERGIRFYFLVSKLKNYDIVQLINEASVKTTAGFEIFLLKKIIQQNKKLFLLSCGTDAVCMQYMVEKKFKYSTLTPYFESDKRSNIYNYMFEYLSKSHLKLHHFLYKNIEGVIASDMDYAIPLEGNTKYVGLIPNPINTNKIIFKELTIEEQIIIFLGINRHSYQRKGLDLFEKALESIEKKYSNKVKIIKVENLPYDEYSTVLDQSHIVLDQVYAYDQGYNALEAMAKGKVVFTGAEQEFEDYYELNERVAINALPDVNELVKELSLLIENPQEIIKIGKNARAFIEKEHDYVRIAEKYLEVWKS